MFECHMIGEKSSYYLSRFILILVVFMGLSFNHEKAMANNKAVDVAMFQQMVEGVWVDKNSIGEGGFEFYEFSNGIGRSGRLPGCVDRAARISHVRTDTQNKYVVTMHYSAERYFMEDYPEEYVDVEMYFAGNAFGLKDKYRRPNVTYSYMGKNVEEAKVAVEQLIKNETVKTWRVAYSKVLEACKNLVKMKGDNYAVAYSLYDIDRDGTPELFLKLGGCEAEYRFLLYTMHQQNTEAVCIANLSGSHASICGFDEPNTFLIHWGHMGYEKITKVTLKNGQLYGEILLDKQAEEYQDLVSLRSNELDRFSNYYELGWRENVIDLNKQILLDSGVISR